MGTKKLDLNTLNFKGGKASFEIGCVSNAPNYRSSDISNTIEVFIFTFVSNGDGTCYISGGLSSGLKGDLILPSVSPNGEVVTSIGGSAFENCDSLTSIEIPDSVTSIGSYAFYECDSLTTVTIGKSVTSIGESAFKNCSSLNNITIPNSVTRIDDYAFHYCTSLTRAYFEDKESSWSVGYRRSGAYPLTYVTITASELSSPSKAAYYLTCENQNKWVYKGWTKI